MDEDAREIGERIVAALEGICTRLDRIVEGNAKMVTENFRQRLMREREQRELRTVPPIAEPVHGKDNRT